MVSPLARSLAPTNGTCGPHNMRSIQQSPCPPPSTVQAAQRPAHPALLACTVAGRCACACLHPSCWQREDSCSAGTRPQPFPSARVPSMGSARYNWSMLVPISRITPMGSKAPATGKQLLDLGHAVRQQPPSRPCRLGPRRDARERRMNLPLSRSPRRRAVGWPPSRDSGQPHAAASRGTDV